MIRHAFATLALLGATACGSGSGSPSGMSGGAGGEPDSCGVVRYMHLQGQPGDAVQRAGISGPVRVIPLGGMVTRDYTPERINFYLDANGLVGRISCG
ncbi:I78 family peptidase inhibitor [Szabonella alba]|uniref:Peptidase inhibitor I78 family protein n=1 Tax=Szabonella alba TaxID=2804194 RepID=A0A8K0XZ60_9RHOB|nr:hypothetical protein [Szabonella alba]